MLKPYDWRSRMIPWAILAAVFLAYLPSLNNGFIETWDDSASLTKNVYVRSLTPADLSALFSTRAFHAYLPIPYVPLTLLSYALEYKFFGYDPFIYHLDNLLLHLGVVFLIFMFIQRLGLSVAAAALASLLFGLHPMHVESVAWITERKDVLYALFYLLALCAYMDYLKTRTKISYALTLFWGLLSILSKPMALSLPLVLFICDWWSRRVFSPRVFAEKVPIFLYMAGIAWITYTKYTQPIHADIMQRVLVWTWSAVFYIGKFLFPSLLLPHYALPRPVLWLHPAYISALGVLMVFAYSLLRFRGNRPFLLAWYFYISSIFFLIRFEDTALSGNLSGVADRFMYLPSLGFCILAGTCLESWIAVYINKPAWQKYLLLICIGIGFLALAGKTWAQCRIWKDDVILWDYQIHMMPRDPLGYINRALGYADRHQYAQAAADDSTALNIDAHDYISSRHPATASAQRIDAINLALANNPFLVVAFRNRGMVYLKMGENELALRDFDRVLEINPRDAQIDSLRRSLSAGQLPAQR